MAREDAYKQMYYVCSGSYKIISEGSKTGDSVALPMYGGGFIMANEQRTYIKFICN